MAQEFTVAAPWAARGWKLKIRDKERVEPPHVSILHKTNVWRFGLRERAFLDREPPAREVPKGLVKDVRNRMDEFVKAWDSLYPENPVNSPQSSDD